MPARANDPVVRVVIASSQAVIRSGVHLAIDDQPDLLVVGEASDLDTALAQLGGRRAQVAVVELDDDGGGPGENVERVLSAQKDLAIVFLSRTDDPAVLASATRAGARAIVSKTAPMTSLLDMIRAVDNGSRLQPAALEARIAAGDKPRAEKLSWSALTPREREVAELVAQGLAYREVASRLNISDHTVKNHLRRIYSKLDINSRVELAVHGAGAARA